MVVIGPAQGTSCGFKYDGTDVIELHASEIASSFGKVLGQNEGRGQRPSYEGLCTSGDYIISQGRPQNGMTWPSLASGHSHEP